MKFCFHDETRMLRPDDQLALKKKKPLSHKNSTFFMASYLLFVYEVFLSQKATIRIYSFV